MNKYEQRAKEWLVERHGSLKEGSDGTREVLAFAKHLDSLQEEHGAWDKCAIDNCAKKGTCHMICELPKPTPKLPDKLPDDQPYSSKEEHDTINALIDYLRTK